MSKIRIKNFGPIKNGFNDDNGWLDIKKVTIFIGNQGSGKSTIAKLISTFTWIEKALTRGDYDKKTFERKDVLRRYLTYHKIENYLIYSKSDTSFNLNLFDTTEIEYIGDSYEIKYSSRHLKITESSIGNYPLPQIMYVPSYRNYLSAIDDIKSQRLFSDSLLELLTELQKSKKEIKKNFKLPINNTDLEYDESKDILYVKGDNYKLNLTESSSGFQSIVPLYLVSWYLANSVKQQSESNKEPMSSDELERFRNGVTDIWSNENLSNEQKRIAISVLSFKFNKTAFINIVEEPEQNLFPVSQRHILNSLLEFNNMNEGNKLIMTTHSPFIINYLTLAVKAFFVSEKIISSNNQEILNPILAKIIPLTSFVNPNSLVIYELDDEGSILKLEDYKGLPSDENYLNERLAESNDLFANLLEIEDLCR